MSLNCDTCTGELVIATISLHTPAWCATDLTALWAGSRLIGENIHLGGNEGDRPFRRERTTTEHSLPFAICGEVDQNGSDYPDPWVGLETNIAYLIDNLVDQPATTAGTRAATLTMPSGATRTADLHVLDIRLGQPIVGNDALTGRSGTAFMATLELSIPAGRFE